MLRCYVLMNTYLSDDNVHMELRCVVLFCVGGLLLDNFRCLGFYGFYAATCLPATYVLDRCARPAPPRPAQPAPPLLTSEGGKQAGGRQVGRQAGRHIEHAGKGSSQPLFSFLFCFVSTACVPIF
jgi:hypothetical protein